MEPFETRPEVRDGADLTGGGRDARDRRTGDGRLNRLRARSVAGGTPAAARPVASWIAVAVLLAFALGLIANPWFERSVRSRLPGFAPTVAPTVGDIAALQARIAVLEARVRTPVPAAVGGGGAAVPSERLARVEATLDRITAAEPLEATRTERIATDLATLTGRIDASAAATAAALASATANAERAQAMIVLEAARRQIAGGARLGELEPALRRAFTARAPQPVEAVAALGAAPTTIAGLRTGLERLRPELTGVAAEPGTPRGWWQGLKDSLSFVVIRRAGTGSDASARVDRAAQALAGGNVAAAVAEIAALPAAARTRAQTWLAAAERYQAGIRGLNALEAEMLEPLPPPVLLATPAATPIRSPVPPV